ncbi:hypothetical protein FRB98_006613 [Tulasnella sp. 332]|nr:hypothetical protein FRB98_006613 [Tulasnella sp. 332]
MDETIQRENANAPALHISYKFSPPSSVSAPDALSPIGSYTFPVNTQSSSSSPSSQQYYQGLRESIQAAKAKTGEDLTVWRDAVGDGEKSKEVMIKEQKSVAEEDGEEEDADADADT